MVVAALDGTAFQLVQALAVLLLCEIGPFLAFDGNGSRRVAEGLKTMGIEDGRGSHC